VVSASSLTDVSSGRVVIGLAEAGQAEERLYIMYPLETLHKHAQTSIK
jgi:hypothetical protein